MYEDVVPIDDLVKLASSLLKHGYNACEAVPITEWREKGYPESRTFYATVDATIKFMKKLEIYYGDISSIDVKIT